MASACLAQVRDPSMTLEACSRFSLRGFGVLDLRSSPAQEGRLWRVDASSAGFSVDQAAETAGTPQHATVPASVVHHWRLNKAC